MHRYSNKKGTNNSLVKLIKKDTAQESELDFLPNTLRIASLAADVKAIHPCALDVRRLTQIADCFIICSAASEPQFKAIFNEVKEGMKEIGITPLHVEGDTSGGWLILDYGSIILHIFREEAREFYDLDGLWGDAPQIDLELEP